MALWPHFMHFFKSIKSKRTSISYILITFWLRQELRQSLCLSVCLFGTSLSKALNFHLSLIVLSQISLRSVSGQSEVSLRSDSGLFVPNSSDSLKYFVLFQHWPQKVILGLGGENGLETLKTGNFGVYRVSLIGTSRCERVKTELRVS